MTAKNFSEFFLMDIHNREKQAYEKELNRLINCRKSAMQSFRKWEKRWQENADPKAPAKMLQFRKIADGLALKIEKLRNESV